jgi:hypothetical protein
LLHLLPGRYRRAQFARAGGGNCCICYRGGIEVRNSRGPAAAIVAFATVAVSKCAIRAGRRRQLLHLLPWRYRRAQFARAGGGNCCICYRGGIEVRNSRGPAAAIVAFATVAVSKCAIRAGRRRQLLHLLPWRYRRAQFARNGVGNRRICYRGGIEVRNSRGPAAAIVAFGTAACS